MSRAPFALASIKGSITSSITGSITAMVAATVVAVAGCATRSDLVLVQRPDVRAALEGVDGREPAIAPNAMRLSPKVCAGVDLRPEYATLDARALVDFLQGQGMKLKVERARADLVFLDVEGAGTAQPVRLRVAILKGAPEAGRELHEAILQHGRGSWGVHRSNLAVLAPIADAEDALAFAVKTKLPCFGVFTMASHDDDFVVPGGYSEL